MNTLNRRILQLAVPCVITNVTVPLLGLCDVAIMGHVGGASHIGAIAVGSMIFNVIYWLFGFLRMGTSGLTSQALGARRLHLVATLLRRGVLLGGALGLLLVAVQVPLRHVAFPLMNATADVAALATPYYNTCAWGAPAVLGLYALNGWLIGMQNTRAPMLIAIGQNVLNILLSLLLVVVLRLGVVGVALGTVVAQWAGFMAALLLVARGYGRLLRRHRSSWADLRRGLGRFFRLNLDIFLRTVCLVAVNLYFTSAGAAQGALVLAANTLLMQFFMLFSYVMDGFAYAGEALAGRYYGARNDRGLRRTVGSLMRWGEAMAAAFTLLYAVGGSAFLHLLTTDEAVITEARCYLPWVFFIPMAGMAAFVWDGIFIGLTASRGMLVACAVGAAAFFALQAGLSSALGNHALWLALVVYLLLRGLTQRLIYARLRAGKPAE